MTVNMFDQFESPELCNIPLMVIAMFTPMMLLRHSNRLIPNRWATLQTHLLLLMAKHLMTPINKPGHVWTLPLVTVQYYLLLINLLGLLPYTFTPTTQLALNLGLALPLWLATVLIGLRNQPSHALAHMLPAGTPSFLIPILIIIETISVLIRPVALAVRLTANLTAGHMLITLVSTATMTTLSTPIVALMAFMLLCLLTVLEIAVAIIQAYVFTLLLSLYLQENT
uniref:ATP synthase subunit a n=1 Tax=Phelsuma laticauda TaxID=143529 RepID=K9JX02_9SAUR|nr:ATPase subunit 6 [Phelsuma laticauda]